VTLGTLSSIGSPPSCVAGLGRRERTSLRPKGGEPMPRRAELRPRVRRPKISRSFDAFRTALRRGQLKLGTPPPRPPLMARCPNRGDSVGTCRHTGGTVQPCGEASGLCGIAPHLSRIRSLPFVEEPFELGERDHVPGLTVQPEQPGVKPSGPLPKKDRVSGDPGLTGSG
jgi:hypothetical protein